MDPRVESKGPGDSHLKEGPLAEVCSTKRTEGYRRFLINLDEDSGKRREATKSLPCPTRTTNRKDKLEGGEGALSEQSKVREPNRRDGVMINFGNLTNSYAKYNTNHETLERVMLAPHYPPEEHKLDNEGCTDKQIYTICQRGSSSAPSKTDSFNRRELTFRVMNAFGKHLNLGGRVG